MTAAVRCSRSRDYASRFED